MSSEQIASSNLPANGFTVRGSTTPIRWALLGAIIAIVLVSGLFAILIEMRSVSSASIPRSLGPQLPVTISFREAFLSRGSVGRVTNFSDRPLFHVSIACSNAALNKSHDFQFGTIDPHQTIVIGWHEGWDFSPGDMLTVSVPGYGTLTRIVNK